MKNPPIPFHAILPTKTRRKVRSHGLRRNSDIIIIVHKRDVTDPTPIVIHKLAVAGGSLILRVGGQHALQGHTHALDRLHGRPAGRGQKVEADDPVAVDVRVHGDRTRCVGG
jgi:hypothetical protein